MDPDGPLSYVDWLVQCHWRVLNGLAERYTLLSSIKLLLCESADGLVDHDDDDKQLMAVCVATLVLQNLRVAYGKPLEIVSSSVVWQIHINLRLGPTLFTYTCQ